ncbi:hypothetical protein BG006_010497 [Podila minutissima]|uniref:EKC/KEOPS complex subunit GON7 n=1 Tax=Podila minutissima TaxID=64525 RepID=A0A9P5VIQ5_9FUNG|nr:hypothetical protein BG006_010497 [Podila minutissima]
MVTSPEAVSVSATYSIASTASTETEAPILTFQAPVVSLSASQDPSDYLTSLAKALNALQESINTGLTERLVQQGVLTENNDKAEGEEKKNTKLRTKVPGQHAPKKGLTKKQKQELELKERQEKKEQEQPATTTSLPPTSETTAAMEVDPSAPSDDVEMDPQGQEANDDDEEAEEEKDEVDLVMEADPGEVDGACLELPKEQDLQQQQQHNKKRIGATAEDDVSEQDLAAKKSKGLTADQ